MQTKRFAWAGCPTRLGRTAAVTEIIPSARINNPLIHQPKGRKVLLLNAPVLGNDNSALCLLTGSGQAFAESPLHRLVRPDFVNVVYYPRSCRISANCKQLRNYDPLLGKDHSRGEAGYFCLRPHAECWLRGSLYYGNMARSPELFSFAVRGGWCAGCSPRPRQDIARAVFGLLPV